MSAKKAVDYAGIVRKNQAAMQRQVTGQVTGVSEPAAQSEADAVPAVKITDHVSTVTVADDVHNVSDGPTINPVEAKPAGRQRKTVAAPGARQGLQPGWTRATMIVREDVLDVLKDFAYTERLTLKEVLDQALTAFADSIDKTKLIHRK